MSEPSTGNLDALAGCPSDTAPQTRAPRKNLLLSATLRSASVIGPVRIRNLSEKGAMVEGEALPEPGSALILQRLEVEMQGVVVWRVDGRCGIRFDGAISVDEWVVGRRARPAGLGQGQLRVDRIQAAIRSGQDIKDDAPRIAAAQSVTEVEARIGEELEYVQRMLDEVGDDLIGDPLLLQRHGDALQRFDNANQILGQLAAVLKAENRLAAIDAVSLEALRARLSRKPNF